MTPDEQLAEAGARGAQYAAAIHSAALDTFAQAPPDVVAEHPPVELEELMTLCRRLTEQPPPVIYAGLYTLALAVAGVIRPTEVADLDTPA